MSFIRRNPYGALAVLSLTGMVGTSLFYMSNREKIALANQTFQIPVRKRDPQTGVSKTVMQRLPVILPDVAERMLSANASSSSWSMAKEGGGVRWNWHTAVVASNHPVEDAHTTAVHGDCMYFGVFDGHSGYVTSQLLQHSLVPAVRLELAERGIDTHDTEKLEKKEALPTKTSSQLLTTPSASISDAIRSAFQKLDDELISTPVRLMQQAMLDSTKKDTPSSDFDSPLRTNPFARTAVQAALNGSCALLAVLDTYRRDLYVACTGDSRAVAGIWDPESRTWSVDVLSDDQTGLSPQEVARMQSEHPEDEKDTVIKHGRVLGGLQPTRAFGDARYKWGKELQERISRMFFSETETLPRPPSIHLKTPPYVTAEPVVTVREDYLPDAPTASSNKGGMRFLILATDGLWDVISSEDACALVAGHLSGLRGRIRKRDLPERLGGKITAQSSGMTKAGEKTDADDNNNRSAAAAKGNWMFSEADEGNIAKHLIRNALGGESRQVREMLSIPPPISRSSRDDISVVVVWWDNDTNAATANEPRAKL